MSAPVTRTTSCILAISSSILLIVSLFAVGVYAWAMYIFPRDNFLLAEWFLGFVPILLFGLVGLVHLVGYVRIARGKDLGRSSQPFWITTVVHNFIAACVAWPLAQGMDWNPFLVLLALWLSLVVLLAIQALLRDRRYRT